ncbi:MAG: DUF3168 domain-containing protein [Bauldia sp.]|nr:DUF3168 domain-containing protein [Bauldia sp.]MCW5777491.1 DUF3168 domain-containing protein [Phycisphaeraceae bacterium]
MSATQIAVKALLAVTGVTAIVGQRVTAVRVPVGSALPAVVVNAISDVEVYTLGGAGGYPEARVSIECIAESPAGADVLGNAVVAGLKDFATTVGGFHATFFKEGTDVFDESPEHSTVSRIIDFAIRWRATA